MDVRSAACRSRPPRGERVQQSILIRPATRSPERVSETRAFLLTKTYMDTGDPPRMSRARGIWSTPKRLTPLPHPIIGVQIGGFEWP
jgi:hypothetical protein